MVKRNEIAVECNWKENKYLLKIKKTPKSDKNDNKNKPRINKVTMDWQMAWQVQDYEDNPQRN